MSSSDETLSILPTRTPTESRVMTFSLVTSDGATWSIGAEEGSTLRVGQGKSADLVLEDKTVSRLHAEFTLIRVDGELSVRVSDLSSSNGTYVDGVRVERAFVAAGGKIRLGNTLLVLQASPSESEAAPPPSSPFGALSRSRAMLRLFPLLERLASSEVSVLILGETGTGKEVLAESLHELGARRDRPFVVFDCTTVHSNLVEAALFGHEKGAFTGATEARAGVFEAANGGTLFIDEIGDLDLALQGKLLRAIDRCEVQRVGGFERRRVNVRIIAATRRNLENAIADGRFRDDLYYRIAVSRVHLPPLRERTGDVEFLASRFILERGGSASDVAAFLRTVAHEKWPGNVRELRNRAHAFAVLGALSLDSTRASEAPAQDFESLCRSGEPYALVRQRVLRQFQDTYVEEMLSRCNGNATQAAKLSGLARRYFQILSGRAAQVRDDEFGDG